MSKPIALIIDDEKDILSLLAITLRRMGIESIKASTVAEAIATLDKQTFDLCLTDLRLPDGSGLDIVKHVQKAHSNVPIAVITAFGDPQTAVDALKMGAFDYVAKPIELEQLKSIINSSIKLSNPKPQFGFTSNNPVDELLGESEPIKKIRELIKKVARNQAPVHIYGETGTGKELIAQSIHRQSPRCNQPFIAVNCGAIPRELIESEFFGHKKGSFTGATSEKTGLFQAANGGTLFLDEVADLPLDLQVKLLRAIQERTIRPVGSTNEVQVDIRLISATHKDLRSMTLNGSFRQDLYYRINVVPIESPTLRSRQSDFQILAQHFVKMICYRNGIKHLTLTREAILQLRSYNFPGNVRELENMLERTIALHDEQNSDSIEEVLLPQSPFESIQSNPQLSNLTNIGSIDEHLEGIERVMIQKALASSHGNITEAAAILGTTFRSLRYKIKKFEITPN